MPDGTKSKYNFCFIGTKMYYSYNEWFLISSWDEWVPEHRVLKYNETNLQRQKELQKEHEAKKEKNKKGKWTQRNLNNYFIF